MAKTVPINLRVTPEFSDRLEKHLAERGLGKTEFIEAVIDHELEAHVVSDRGPGRPSVANRVAQLESRIAELERIVK